jgi:hypothetical protein
MNIARSALDDACAPEDDVVPDQLRNQIEDARMACVLQPLRSRGSIVADGLRPTEFEDRRSRREARRHEFDAADKAPTLERQDQLSLAWTFAFAPPRGTVNVRVADGKRISAYVYKVVGRERVKTPAGEFDGLKLVKQKDNADAKSTEVWLAADRNFLPVRVLIVDKEGTRMDQVATKISAQ